MNTKYLKQCINDMLYFGVGDAPNTRLRCYDCGKAYDKYYESTEAMLRDTEHGNYCDECRKKRECKVCIHADINTDACDECKYDDRKFMDEPCTDCVGDNSKFEPRTAKRKE